HRGRHRPAGRRAGRAGPRHRAGLRRVRLEQPDVRARDGPGHREDLPPRPGAVGGPQPMKILLPTVIPLDPAVPDGVELVRFDPAEPIPDSALDAEALVAWGIPRVRLVEAAQ